MTTTYNFICYYNCYSELCDSSRDGERHRKICRIVAMSVYKVVGSFLFYFTDDSRRYDEHLKS